MPHDANGKLIEVGDIVHIPARVTMVSTGEDYCNVNVDLLHPMPPYTNVQSLGALNTRQVIKQEQDPA